MTDTAKLLAPADPKLGLECEEVRVHEAKDVDWSSVRTLHTRRYAPYRPTQRSETQVDYEPDYEPDESTESDDQVCDTTIMCMHGIYGLILHCRSRRRLKNQSTGCMGVACDS